MITPSYGVIVARCQVHELHDGHLALFREVKARHNRVILFLGVKPVGSTYKNPLDFETRKAMIQAKFPEFYILPLLDMQSDIEWSNALDRKIAEIADYGSVTLYGGRDSFVPHYDGRHKPVELALPYSLDGRSGTEIRGQLTNTVMESSDFRAGVIYGITNLRPSVKTTVDIVIVHRRARELGASGVIKHELHFLLGRKPHEDHWRFIGGHAEPESESFEQDVCREAYEESGLDLTDIRYIGSTKITDWRWQGEPDQVKTLIFTANSRTMAARPGDDIAEVKWVEYLSEGMLVKAHWPIREKVLNAFNIRGQYATAAKS